MRRDKKKQLTNLHLWELMRIRLRKKWENSKWMKSPTIK